MRRHNLALILGEVHRDGALTRAELTARLGVSRSTVGALVNDLVDLGLVEERVPTGGTRAGRPSHVVMPRLGGPYVIAVDVAVHHLTIAAVGLGGDLLARRTVPIEGDIGASHPAAVAQEIIAAIPELRAQARLKAPPIGLGVSVPGTIDRHNGVVGLAPNLGWRNAPFRAQLAATAGADLPVFVGNDADLSVLAEHIRGRARGCNDVVFLIGRTGVGAGIIANGVPLRGHDGHAGEIGHTVVDAAGPACHCGKHGCLEAYVGDLALLDLTGVDDVDRIDQVFAAARAGDDTALKAVRTVAGSLGRAVATLVNTLNPERVVLGGSFAEVLDLAREEVETSLGVYVLDAPGETVLLDRPALGADSALLGAAEIAFAQLLADPLSGQSLAAR